MKVNRALTTAQRRLTIAYASFLILFVVLFTAVPLYLQNRVSRYTPAKNPMPSQSSKGETDTEVRETLQRNLQKFQRTLLAINGTFIVIAIVGSHYLARKTLRPLERTLNQQEAFAAEIAHELKTPLANMLMQISAYKKTHTVSKGERALLDDVALQTKELGMTADNILQLMAVEFVDETLYKQPVNVGELARTCTKGFTSSAKEKDVSLHCHTQPGIVINANAVQIKQLITILLDNALKFTSQEGSVTLTVERLSQKAVLSVSDTGVGMDEDAQKMIFDRFYQIDSSTGQGAGLGLAIAKRIVDLHNASLTVQSAPNRGTTMKIIFHIAS